MNHKVNRVLKLFLLGFIFTFGLLFLPTQVTIFADDPEFATWNLI